LSYIGDFLVLNNGGAEMTDLEVVEMAVKAVLDRGKKENPSYFPVPITGFTVMEWFQEALVEARKEQSKRKMSE
jgi:hypothetical protein